MIVAYYKGYVTSATLKEMIRMKKRGTTAYDLIEALKTLGFRANGYQLNMNILCQKSTVFPLILHVIIRETYHHYIVLYRFDAVKQRFYVADPMRGKIWMSKDALTSILGEVMILCYPYQPLLKEQKSVTLTSLFTAFYKQYPVYFRRIILLSFLFTMLSIVSSFSTKYMLDGITDGQSKSALWQLFILFFFICMIKELTGYYREYLFIIVREKINFFFTTDFLEHIILLPYQYYHNRTTGDLVSRIQDFQKVRDGMAQFFLTFFVDFTLFIVSFLMLCSIQFYFGMLAIIIFILYMVQYLFYYQGNRNTIKNLQNMQGIFSSVMIENLSSYETIKGLHLEQTMIEKLKEQYFSLVYRFHKFEQRMHVQNQMKTSFQSFIELSITFYACLLLLQQEITFGTFFLFQTLFGYFITSISSCFLFLEKKEEAISALERIADITVSTKVVDKKDTITTYDIRCNHVTFQYEDKTVLNDVSLFIPTGDRVMILGKSGSGKSTLFHLLMGYEPLKKNSIWIGGKDIYENQAMITSSMSYVSQDISLFTETLSYNIKCGRVVSEEEFELVLKITRVCEILEKHHSNIHMLIEEHGMNLSGGERQRILLARALLSTSQILIIDEGFSQMDIMLERDILKSIFEQYQDKTIILVSHRTNNLDLFSHVIELEKGIIRRNRFRRNMKSNTTVTY